MYREDAFKSLALLYCFRTQIKQEDAKLVQIQEVAELIGGTITSMMVALAFARQRLQQVPTDVDSKLATEVVLVFKELENVASTRPGHVLCLTAVSFNSLSETRRKEVVDRS